jgi:TolB protein
MMHLLIRVKALEIEVTTIIVLFGILTACSVRDLSLTEIEPELAIASTPQNQATDSNLIVVAEIEEGNLDIVTISMSGHFLERLTTNHSVDIYPSLSPDGEKIAFTSIRDDEANIYVINTDGSNETQLTRNSGSNTAPSWSPDGKLIAYTTSLDGKIDINIINVETGEISPLVIQDSNIKFVAKQHPAWSPDGEKIAFEGFTLDQRQADIYSVNVDGSNLALLSGSPFDEVYPSWSPDGNQLAFSSNRDGITSNTYKIYILDLPSGLIKRLTSAQTREVEQYPEWLPDGERLVYVNSESPSIRNIVIASINSESLNNVHINEIKIVGFPQVMD